jgi:prevent-host-death family protein
MLVNVADMKTKFSSYLKRSLEGESIIICNHNVAVAEIVPIKKNVSSNKRRPLGLAKGKVKIAKDFNEPLKEFEKEFYHNDLISTKK